MMKTFALSSVFFVAGAEAKATAKLGFGLAAHKSKHALLAVDAVISAQQCDVIVFQFLPLLNGCKRLKTRDITRCMHVLQRRG
mmetsp:Transcript_8103/g.16818  ORF Transcript_8103/g.16818 Transcript_8103/m.16818 type:complete len:83 (-) Transcript_8103:365-613(-)